MKAHKYLEEKEMKKTQQLLTVLFLIITVCPLGLYVSCEFFDISLTCLDNASDSTKFITQTGAILLTLALVPFALRMFKIKRIHNDLMARKEKALKQWGGLRLGILGLLLLANTMLYYIFGLEPAFGYLAIVIALTLPFVLPTRERCKAETEPLTEQKAEPTSNDGTE